MQTVLMEIERMNIMYTNKANEFSNYSAFLVHFKPLVIQKVAKDFYRAAYQDEVDRNPQDYHYIQQGTASYIDGWLYGAVQTVCGQIVKR